MIQPGEKSESIYAPPVADVTAPHSDSTDFYVVGSRKFYLLSILTLNTYLVYWFYRNWWHVKQRTGESLWAPMRGLFYIFFTHSLFDAVEEKINSLGQKFDWEPRSLATVAVVLTVLVNVLDRLSSRDIGSPFTDLISLALIPIIPAILLKAQHAINFACEDPTGSSNSTITWANWIWMVLGVLLWFLILIGLYLITFEPDLLLE